MPVGMPASEPKTALSVFLEHYESQVPRPSAPALSIPLDASAAPWHLLPSTVRGPFAVDTQQPLRLVHFAAKPYTAIESLTGHQARSAAGKKRIPLRIQRVTVSSRRKPVTLRKFAGLYI